MDLLFTHSFFLIETQDLHGLQSLIKHLIILLALDLHMPGYQETVITKVLKQKLFCGKDVCMIQIRMGLTAVLSILSEIFKSSPRILSLAPATM